MFYVNLPVGVIALTVLWFSFPNIRPHMAERRIDFPGALCLIAGVVPLLLALSWHGTEYPWSSPQIVGLFAIAAVMLVAFGFVESRASEPIIPLTLFHGRVIQTSVLALTLMAMSMFGTILFIPLFIQGVIGTTATQSGTVLMPMMFVMISSSIISGQIISRTGAIQAAGLFGMTVMAGGLLLLSGMGPQTDYLSVLRNMIIVGIGIGPTMPVFTSAAQNSVKLSQPGVVTSLTQFARSIGSTIGVAVFGSLLTNRFGPAFQEALLATVTSQLPPDRLAQFQNPQALLNPQAADAIRQQFVALGPQGAQLYDALFGVIKIGLVTALHDIFMVAAVLVALGGVAVIYLPAIPLRKTHRPPAPAEAPASETDAQVGQDAIPSLPSLKPEDHPGEHAPHPAAPPHRLQQEGTPSTSGHFDGSSHGRMNGT